MNLTQYAMHLHTKYVHVHKCDIAVPIQNILMTSRMVKTKLLGRLIIIRLHGW